MAQKNPSREEILEQLTALNKASDTKGPTRGGRTSGQGVSKGTVLFDNFCLKDKRGRFQLTTN